MRPVHLLVGVFLVFVSGCVSPFDPDTHPNRLEPVDQRSTYRPVDLDGDGRDERVRKGQLPNGKEESVIIKSLSGRATAQVHFAGEIISLQFLDLTQNGDLEIVAAVVKEDSLFYNVVSAVGEKLHRFHVLSGEPRQEPGGTIQWDLRGAYIRRADVLGDGTPELISFFRTGYARQPRGVWIHTYPEGEQVGRQRIGGLVRGDFYFGDIDEDTVSEWIFGTIATNNGAEAGGMRDDRAYLGAIEAGASPHVEWSREIGETFSAVELAHGDLDGDREPEFVALRVPRSGRQTRSPLYQVDPTTGETLQRHLPDRILQSIHVGTLGEDGRDRIVVRDASGAVHVLNHQFEVVHRRSIEAEIRSVRIRPDLNGDDREEIVVQTERGALWLGADLSVRASTQQEGDWRVIQTGIGRPPHVAITQGGTMTRFRPADNMWWWVYRYGPSAGLMIGVLILIGGGIVGSRRYHQIRLRETVHKQVAAGSDRAWILIHPNEGVQRVSTSVPKILGLPGEETPSYREVQEQAPELTNHFEQLARQETGPGPEEVTIREEAFTVTCTPLEVMRNGRPYWLVWLDPVTPEVEEYRVQGLMAQQVAHDLKNPLTSILLTLQRMQMAYQEQAPELADTLDEYTGRIEERISSLRRMTTNVLKFVGKEEIRRTPTDLSGLMSTVSETIEQSLPPDIHLKRQFEDDLPAAPVDQDQMRSVVENLVTNAIEAMPEGGVLTIATRLERDLHLKDHPRKHDYVIVEVRDTGLGMTADEQERLFDLGFSTRGDTGLGMALVQKIIEDHDGQVEVESEPDVGTSVTLYLPTEREAGPSPESD